VDKRDVDRWLERYVEAWKTYDRDQIAALFGEEVSYRFHPYDEPILGRDAVVEAWLGESDQPGASTRDELGTYDATYRTVAIDGDVAVATGATTYRAQPGGPVSSRFDNCFVMRFESGGRCAEFTEWYVERPG
jgi:Domain of unknown function (DUF4440)